jgi:hypothetical protein
LPYQAEQRTDSRLQKTTDSAPEIHIRNWLRRNEFTLRPLTDVSSSKMLRDARMAALTGCAAASCQRVNGRSGPEVTGLINSTRGADSGGSRWRELNLGAHRERIFSAGGAAALGLINETLHRFRRSGATAQM